MGFRVSLLGAILVSFVFVLGCASKNKKGGSAGGDLGVTISNLDIGSDSTGSDGGNIRGLSTVYFAYDRASLDEETKAILNKNAMWLKKRPNSIFEIQGHCDSRGSVEYNLALGERRAEVVKQYLIGLGLNPKNLKVLSYGKEKPLSFGASDVDHARNRRVNFLPLPK